MVKITVLIYDSPEYIRSSYYDEFMSFSEIEISAKAYTAGRCIELAERLRPDVLIFDIDAEADSENVIRTVKKECPRTKIIVLSQNITDFQLFRAVADGADNFCSKSLPPAEILKNIKDVFRGNTSLNPEISQKLINRTREVNDNMQSLLYMYINLTRLSKGEFDLLYSLYKGEKYKDIADRKVIEVTSVKKMASRLLKRMGIKNMSELLKQLHELRLFELIEKTAK